MPTEPDPPTETNFAQRPQTAPTEFNIDQIKAERDAYAGSTVGTASGRLAADLSGRSQPQNA